ncbi:Fusaric acid resistance protein-like-domain-containing protein [Podospora aff. communis PSN243]|uniref:Fusaric acid resistance protein-like-domain-containing protein n=1 Tax=Podospora aff. communis PSN243 TaxID=3040156 RepID=A0AAV9GVN6_9PEZI|nr:Fusaric acid resistance protein-like-domain-containing protein [Podospora aff. communis PSN243]
MSSASATPSAGQWPPRRPSKRSKLRNGTFIIPNTGERSRRHFTLRTNRSDQIDGPDDSTTLPLFSARQSLSERSRAVTHNIRTGVVRFLRWLDSPTGHGVLKCTIAYTLASLATFWEPISEYLGKPDGKHVVATITVYFHPARTAGSMIEAILVALVAIAYAESVSILSMCTSVLIGSTFKMVTLAHAITLVVFVGGGFGCIGWVKQKMNNPLVSVGSTLASLAIIAVVTKETSVFTHVFSNQKIIQIFKMLIMAVTTTTAVNLLLWRVQAADLLRESMTKASSSLGDMLAMITRGFLSGSEDDLLSSEFSAATSAYAAVYPQLTKNLREAKFERYFVGHEKLYQLDRAVVRSMETLAQSIGGLRSAANTQFALLNESMGPLGTYSPPVSPSMSPTLQRSISAVLNSSNGKDRFLTLSSIDEASDESNDERNQSRHGSHDVDGAKDTPTFRNPSDIFEHFITLLGPSMKSLAFTLSEVLREPPFGSAPEYKITVNEHFRQSLTDALSLFNIARANALEELYKNLELGRARTERIQADFEEVAAACGHFSFSLQSFGEEMQKYLDVLDDLKHANEHRSRSWNWLKWWKDGKARKYHQIPYHNEERETLIKPIKKTAIPRGISDTMISRRDTYSWDATPQTSRIVSTLSQRILRFVRKLARDDIRFGLKVGMGACLWATFSFIPQTRELYRHWRGEWGLLSFMIVCSMTVGASNTTGWSRFMGTLIGVSATLVNWNATQGNAVGLIIMGWFVAFWSFWMIVARGKAPLGRITLLAYNVSTLYAYSLSQAVDDDDDDEGGTNPIIGEIVRHRFFAVTAGILWGLIVCRLIWPISARKKFKQGLSMLYLQMGLIWKRGPLAILLRSDCSRSYLRSGEQQALQKYAARLDVLRESAASEFELRGPFPSDQSARLMRCTNRILDAFYAMSLVTQRKGRLTDGERALLLYTADERAQLCDRICHVFQVLASSLMLEYPLTDALPSVVGTRDRLLGKIFQFRKEHVPPQMGGTSANGGEAALGGLTHVAVEERDYALLYAYALVTGQVAEELRRVAKEIEGLYGVLGEESLLLQ